MQRCRESRLVSSLQRRAERGRRVQGYWSESCGMVSLRWTFPCSCIFSTQSVHGLHVNTCFIFPPTARSWKGSGCAEAQRPEIQYEPKASEEIKYKTTWEYSFSFLHQSLKEFVMFAILNIHAKSCKTLQQLPAFWVFFLKPFDFSTINAICQGFLFS